MLYIFYGSDEFSRAERLRALKTELDSDGSLQSTATEFQVSRTTPAEVMAACDTLPFLSGRRLVVLEGALSGGTPASAGRGRRPRRFSPAGEDDSTERGPWWALVDYARRMPETTTLVLVDGRYVNSDLLDALKPLAKVERFSLPAENRRDIQAWVRGRARARGLRIEDRACATIAERIGNDTCMLANEIEKLASFARGDIVREKDAAELVPDIRDVAGYLLADALAEGRAAQATKLLHQMLKKEHHPGALLLTINNRYRRMLAAKEMLDGGATGASIGDALRMRGYALERLLEQTERYSRSELRAALEAIAQSDQDVKEGLYDDLPSLELLVQDLASIAGSEKRGAQRASAAATSSR